MLRIKEIREKKKLSQDEIVARTRIPKRSYLNYENEKTDVPLSKLQNIARALDVKIQDLISTSEGEMLKSEADKEEKQHASEEDETDYPSLSTVRDEIRGDLKVILEGMTSNFNTVSDGIFHVLKDTQKINKFIDKLNAEEIMEAGKGLRELLKERNESSR